MKCYRWHLTSDLWQKTWLLMPLSWTRQIFKNPGQKVQGQATLQLCWTSKIYRHEAIQSRYGSNLKEKDLQDQMPEKHWQSLYSPHLSKKVPQKFWIGINPLPTQKMCKLKKNVQNLYVLGKKSASKVQIQAVKSALNNLDSGMTPPTWDNVQI